MGFNYSFMQTHKEGFNNPLASFSFSSNNQGSDPER